MSREFRDIAIKSVSAAGDIEEKRGLLPKGGSGRMWKRTYAIRDKLGGNPFKLTSPKDRRQFARAAKLGGYLADRAQGSLLGFSQTNSMPKQRRGVYRRGF